MEVPAALGHQGTLLIVVDVPENLGLLGELLRTGYPDGLVLHHRDE